MDADFYTIAMIIKPAAVCGNGMVVIYRFKAVGLFLLRHGAYAQEGQNLDGFAELTIKYDERLNPSISATAFNLLGILSIEDHAILKERTIEIANSSLRHWIKKLTIYYIKLAFGRDAKTNEILLIDEFSRGICASAKGIHTLNH